MKALFICDDKEEWNTLNRIFRGNFPKVELVCAMRGQDALDYLSYEGPFGVVIIDVGMKNENPTDLGHQLLEVGGERPLIFIGSKAMIKDRVSDDLFQAHEANILLETPYKVEELVEGIKNCMEWAKQEEFEQSIEELDQEELLPMKIRNFYLFDSIPYDVYLELTQTKFTKIISKNKPYTHSMIQQYSRKNIKFLYLKKNEYLKFLEESVQELTKILGQSSRGKNESNILFNQIKAALITHQYLKSVGVTESLIKLCQNVISSISDIANKNSTDFISFLNRFPFKQKDYAEQAILTAYISQIILIKLGWNSDLSRNKLCLASLLYDSMLTNEDLIKIDGPEDPRLEGFTEEEQKEFLNHVQRACDLCQHFQGFTELDFIILQHHERPNGKGFPNGVASNKITAISSIFIIASDFSTQLAIKGYSPQNIKDTISSFKAKYKVGNFKEPMLTFFKTLN